MVGEKPNELELLGTNQGRHGRFLAGKTARLVPHPSVPHCEKIGDGLKEVKTNLRFFGLS